MGILPGESGSQGGSALGVVTEFYEACVIPEKRDFEPFRIMTEFYSHLSEPLGLIAVTQPGDGWVIARYRYRDAMKKSDADGRALLTLQERGSELLIEQIKANC